MKAINIIFYIVAAISAFVCVYFMARKCIAWIRIRRLNSESVKSDNKTGVNIALWTIRNGVNFLKPFCRFLIAKSAHIKSLSNQIKNYLKDKNIISNEESILSSVMFVVLLLWILFSCIFFSPISGLAITISICAICVIVVKATIDKKISSTRSSIPELINSLSVLFSSGQTPMQAFVQISKESEGIIKKLFTRCTNVLNSGASVHESLQILRNNKDIPELSFIAVAMDVQHQTGGSIRPVLDSAKDAIKEKIELMQGLQVQTAQAKLSARIVVVLPFALIGVFSILSPDFLLPFFSSFLGVFILALAVVLQISGIILVRKMLKVEI